MKILLCSIFLLFILQFAKAQCTVTINTFPYTQDFETSNGGWLSGGIGNDWEWGTPTKTVINAAGSGTKCWIAGGVSATSYNLGERSYITTPCFDFTNIAKPVVSFKVFWETEKQFDGATFQYSTNGGTTWTNVGTNTDPVDCLNQNWFNSGNISGLSTLAPAGSRHGWAGNIQPTVGACLGGDGLGQWVIARHCMPTLAGLSSVMFRFAFGAGTNCNAYEGFAIDSFVLREAPSMQSIITANCIGNNAFSLNAANALCYTNFAWNFNDPGSGANNTASGTNASHTFAMPGTFNVRVIASGGCAKTDTTFYNVYVPQTDISTGVLCNATSIIASANVVNPPIGDTFSYSWNTVPVQNTATVTNLLPGTYTVTVTQANGCTYTQSVAVALPAPITFQTNVISTFCNGTGSGSINVVVSGGDAPYTYAWNPNVGNTQTVSGLSAGNYTIIATDIKGCTASTIVALSAANGINLNTVNTKANCGKANGTASVNVQGGVAPFTYLWNTNSTNSSITNAAGIYICTVTDSKGCSKSISTTILEGTTFEADYLVKNDTCFKGNGEAILQNSNGNLPYSFNFNGLPLASGLFNNLKSGTYTIHIVDAKNCVYDTTVTITNFSLYTKPDLGADRLFCIDAVELDAGNFVNYLWNDGSTKQKLIVKTPGIYFVKISNEYGCTAGDTIVVKEDCIQNLFFANAFSPNSDGVNDGFSGVTAKPQNLDLYELNVYNRWGENVFKTNNYYLPFIGVFKGNDLPLGTYFYVCNYRFIGEQNKILQGDVILLR